MPGGKAGPISATPSPRMFAKRKDGLKGKAKALATNCDVDVAVICSGPGGAGDLDCWPSKEEVSALVRRYNALPPEQREKHKEDTADNVARRLAEEGRKLDRAREAGVSGALGSWDGSLEGVAEGKLRELLALVEGSLAAAQDRVVNLQTQPPRGGAAVAAAADRATAPPSAVHAGKVAAEESVSETGNGVQRPQPRVGADTGGGAGGLGLPPEKTPKSPNAAPVDAGAEALTGEDAGDEVQILNPPGDADADADDASGMRDLVGALKEMLRPYNAAAHAVGCEYIKVGRFVMERDGYDFIRFDLGMLSPAIAAGFTRFGIGMPTPCIAPDSPDDDGEPLKLWSWDNTMPLPK